MTQLLGFTVAHGLRKFSSVVILAKIGFLVALVSDSIASVASLFN